MTILGSKAALQVNVSGDADLSHLSSKLQCPNCLSPSLSIVNTQAAVNCPKCGSSYPLISDSNAAIPFMFSHVATAKQGWSARLNGFLHKNAQDIDSLKKALKDKKLSTLTRQRIKHLLKAKESYTEQINDPLQFFNTDSFDQSMSTNAMLAANQGVDSYINNVFRDWCWENGENEQLLLAVSEVLPDPAFTAGEVLTIGAGASRFSFDFHHRWQAAYSVLLDINPFLLNTASKVIAGESVSLYEFPVAPASSDDVAVLQECKAPDTVSELHTGDFDYILADAGNAPFTDKSFDTVLTPWLIDIIPMDLREFIPHINRLLKSGGRWINTGSLAFFHKQESWNYSEAEVVDLLKKYGFEIENVGRKIIDYLHSPHSAHGRIENVFSFSAVKKFDSVAAKPYVYLPEWITQNNVAIPQLKELMAVSSKHLLQAQVLSAIDGVRSIEDIGSLLANQYGMPPENAAAAVRQILIDNYKEYMS